MSQGGTVGTPVPTPGHTAYADLEFATNYLVFRLDTLKWDFATDAEKEAALQMASDDIDNLPLHGYQRSADQARRFPRNYATDATIPINVQKACVELALAYIKGVDSQEEYSLLTRREMVYATIRETRDTTRMEPHILAGIPSLRAFNWLVPFLRDERSGRLVRQS